MVTVYVDRTLDEPTRRAGIYAGDIHMCTRVPQSRAIVDWARTLIAEAFGNLDPQRAQFALPLDDFVARVGPLKSRFTNDDRTKELVRDLVTSMGHDPERTYFDLPRLRVVPSDAYLTSGVSYAYKAHRDTWYAHPKVLVNYWVPVFDCVGDNVMSMWVGYWDRAVPNSSSGFDLDFAHGFIPRIGEENYKAVDRCVGPTDLFSGTSLELPWAIVDAAWAERKPALLDTLRGHGTHLLFDTAGWRHRHSAAAERHEAAVDVVGTNVADPAGRPRRSAEVRRSKHSRASSTPR
jgi:hypothetical protein